MIPEARDTPDADQATRLDRAARACVVAGVVAVLVFAAWQFAMPADFVSVRGLNPRAIAEWRTRFGLPVISPSLAVYTAVFRAALVLAWVGCAGFTWLVFRGARLTRRWTWPLALPIIVVLAVAMPADLSTDVFAYVGYARLSIVHGLNPHLATQVDLVRLGDPTAPYLHWPIPSPYGPLWTLISMAIVALAPAGSVWGPVVVLKLCAGAGLLGAAAAARAIVRRVDASRADATFVLVALNPLLLIEGPGNGHNDVVMVALLLGGFAALGAGRSRVSAIAVGAAGAIKVIPLVVVPWLAVLAIRAARPGWVSRPVAAIVVVLLAGAPIVAAYVPFWSGTRTLAGLAERWRHAGSADDGSALSATAVGARDPRTPATGAAAGTAVSSSSQSPPHERFAPAARRLLARSWPALLVFLWASLAIGFGQGAAVFRLATVWAYVALAIMLFVAGLWFPWYLAWIWPLAVLRFSRPHLALSLFVLPFSLLLMLAYAMAPGS